jgi:D-amino-acid dehydrogenase
MKVIILGAGVIGVTSAYILASRGYEVEVIDRQPDSARETSFANGGQLSYSHAEPWANPGVIPKIAKWLFKEDAPLVFRPRADMDMIKWGLKFLANCTENNAKSNSVSLLKLGLYSRKKMEQLRVYTGIDFHNIREGILHIFSDPKEFEAAKKQAAYQEKFGHPSEICDVNRCITLEPALQHSGKKLVGGIFDAIDESGDIFVFTQKLAALCESEYKVQFHYNTVIKDLNYGGGKILSVSTDKGEMKADSFVMSLGSYTPIYMKNLGIKVPIYPMKGYSVTLQAVPHYTPTISLTDSELKIVYSRLGDKLRIAGTAEFAGYNCDITPHRVKPIYEAAKKLFPKAEFAEPLSSWACLRPSTPDGPPIIGKTKISNLFMNTGHGTLGWTQAAGSANLLADVMENRPTEIRMDGLTLDRY